MKNRQFLRSILFNLKISSISILTLAQFQTLAMSAPITSPVTVPVASPQPSLTIAIADEAAFFGLFDLNRPELASVKTAVEAKNWPAAKEAWALHLENRTSPKPLWSHRDKARIIALLKEKDNGLTRFIAPADKVLRREFNPQGIPYQLQKNIDWQLPNSEETHVLSRMAYWRDMGLAYWETSDPKYARDFVDIMNDWIDDNPVPSDLKGAQKPNTRWRTLETGIRVGEWLNTMHLFMSAPEFDVEAKYRISKSLVEHARYLHEWNTIYRRGNWQVVETSSLAMMGILFPEAKEADGWRKRAFDLLGQHMKSDVLLDGSHSEFTPGYHQWVMSQYTLVAQLCKTNGYQVPGLLDRHEKMYEWLMHILKPNRTGPSSGDARNPKLESDMATGALLYNRPDMRFLGTDEGPVSWVWTFGADAFEQYDKIPARKPDFTSIMTPDSKYLAMRTGWDKDDNYLLFSNTPYGGGHSHNDRLQVVLYAGRDLLIDPGIYSYNQPLASTYFRTGKAHNVLLIDGQEQPKFDPKVLAWKTTPEADFGSGFIEQDGLRHQRSVLFLKPNYSVVVDHVTGEGEHEVKRLFHFPLVEAKVEGTTVRTTFPDGLNVQIQVADDARLEMGKGWVPTGGATAEEAPAPNYISKGSLPMTLATVITTFRDAKALPKVERLTEPNAQIARLRVTFPDGQIDEIAVAASPTTLQIGTKQTQARALCVRKGPQSNSTIEITD